MSAFVLERRCVCVHERENERSEEEQIWKTIITKP